MRNFKVEYTDTLGGDANYSWCERETVTLSDCATDRQIVLACKNAVGLSGVKCDRQEWGEGIMLHPRGECTVVFIYPQYWITFANIIFTNIIFIIMRNYLGLDINDEHTRRVYAIRCGETTPDIVDEIAKEFQCLRIDGEGILKGSTGMLLDLIAAGKLKVVKVEEEE